jgi:Mn2+/Fe2+ NRAMP family transporter
VLIIFSEVINPLIELLRMSLTLNIFTLILVLILLILIFNRFIIRTNLDIISKYLPNSFIKAQGWVNVRIRQIFIIYVYIYKHYITIYFIPKYYN